MRAMAVIRLVLIALLLAVPCRDAAAQPSGRVIDGATGAPIDGATVTADDGTSAQSAGDGRFAIQAAGGAVLVVVADGYEAALVIVERDQLGDVVLLPEGIGAEVIEVSGRAPAPAPGAANLDRTDAARVPGTGGDLVQTLKAFPGVASVPLPIDFSGIVIRGSAPEDSRLLIDGFPVPFLYHALGLRSVVPVESVADIQFLPGGFDVGHGKASSGIVALTTRGGGDTLHGQSELSVIDGGVLAQGPAGERGNFLVAVRRSTMDLVLPLVIPADAGITMLTVPYYYDAQARVDLRPSDEWTVALSAIGSHDAMELYGDDEEDPDLRFSQTMRFLRLTGDARWHRGAWTARTAASAMLVDFDFQEGRDHSFDLDAASGTVRGDVVRATATAAGLRNVELRAGGEVDVARSRFTLELPRPPDEGEPGGVFSEPDEVIRFDGVVWLPDVAAWTSVAADFGPRIRLTTGLRVDAFLRNRDLAIQPRGELAVRISERLRGRLSAGAYQRPPENQDELMDRDLDPERATQVIAGLELAAAPGLHVQTSAYATERTALLTRAMGEYANVGRGRSVGVELLARLQRGRWFGWLSYAVSRSTRVDEPGAAERLFDYDQPHNLVAALSWRSGGWQIGGRFNYASGLPDTPVIGAVLDSDTDTYMPIYGDVNSRRLPARHQFDVRIDRSWRMGRLALSAFLDIQNVYLNSTVAGYAYSYDYSERVAFETLPIVPSIGLRGEL